MAKPPNQSNAQALVEQLESIHGAEKACRIMEQCLDKACHLYTPKSGNEAMFGLLATELEKVIQETKTEGCLK